MCAHRVRAINSRFGSIHAHIVSIVDGLAVLCNRTINSGKGDAGGKSKI